MVDLWWWKGLSETTIKEPESRQGLFFDTRYLYNRTVKLTKASLSLNYSTESESLINCTDWNFLTRQFNAFIEKIWIDQFVYFWSFAISDWDFNLLILIVNISPRQFPVFTRIEIFIFMTWNKCDDTSFYYTYLKCNFGLCLILCIFNGSNFSSRWGK